jgi:hypothetical protein
MALCRPVLFSQIRLGMSQFRDGVRNVVGWYVQKSWIVHNKMLFYLCTQISKRSSYPCNTPWKPIGLWDVEAPHFLDIRLTDGAEVVCLPRWPAALYPLEDSWYSFLLKTESTQLEGLGQLGKQLISSEIRTATSWLVARGLSQPHAATVLRVREFRLRNLFSYFLLLLFMSSIFKQKYVHRY